MDEEVKKRGRKTEIGEGTKEEWREDGKMLGCKS